MNSKPSMKQISTWREQLQQIIQMQKKEGELVPAKQSGELKKLAQEVGASTRGIGYREDGKPFGYDASIAELIDNIHKALQTLTFIKNCEYTRWYICIAATALIFSMIFSQRSISIAQDANTIALDALRNSYVPWLSVTFVKPTLIDSNSFEVAIRCKNFSNAPALNLDIKYDIPGITTESRENLYESDALMPNDERELKTVCTVRNGDARQILDELNNGELSLSFDLNYEDVFSRKIEIRQVRKRIMNDFRNTTYEVIKGLD